MTQQLRLAVIGAGAMGRDHIRYIQDNPDAALVAIADPMHESEELAKSIGVAWYADYNDMFDHVELDGVVIASPNSLHLPMARAALKHGVPPLVEKPISDDLDETRASSRRRPAKSAFRYWSVSIAGIIRRCSVPRKSSNPACSAQS